MRPQQQNRRMRGRNNNNNNSSNNNNRKGGPNPLTRSYESNGPDVKIRGNAQQIAEKYTTLARDAMSSGDRVMAENYLQHAEHYNRIIAAAQAQMPIQNLQQNRDEFDDEEGDEGEFERQGNGQQMADGSGPQPIIEGMPAEVVLNGDTQGDGNRQQNGREGFRGRERREGRDRNQNGGSRNGDYQRRDSRRDESQVEGEAQPLSENASDDSNTDTLPSFLTAGVQVPEVIAEEPAPRRSRRPRRGERVREDEENVPQAEAAPQAAEAPASPEVFAGSDE